MRIRSLKFVLIAMGSVGILLALWMSQSVPDESVPVPNGYDDFLAASELVSDAVTNWNRLARTELQTLVKDNTDALRLVHLGLAKTCKVVPYVLSPTDLGHGVIWMRMDLVTGAFAAQARLEVLEGRTNNAALVCLDWIRYGQERGRGGAVIDDGCGIRTQVEGLTMLETLVLSVDSAVAQKVAAELKALISRHESAERVWSRDLAWSRGGRFGWFARVESLIPRFRPDRVKAKLWKRHEDLDEQFVRVILEFDSRARSVETNRIEKGMGHK